MTPKPTCALAWAVGILLFSPAALAQQPPKAIGFPDAPGNARAWSRKSGIAFGQGTD